MKRIKEYKKIFKVEGAIDLKSLKSEYRSLIKEWHPDKYPDPEEKERVEEYSQKIIDGYHFLISMAPKTLEDQSEEYNTVTIQSPVSDYHHKSMLLEVTFSDGNTYEYFGVNKRLFNKFINSKSLNNFGKRNIFNSFPYRKSKKASVMV